MPLLVQAKFHPQISFVQAQKGTSFDPDNPKIVKLLLAANYIFAGPGSSTYTVRNLKETLASEYEVVSLLLETAKDGLREILGSFLPN